jgi:hypothetical protein
MGTPYTGDDSSITAHSAATATIPADTDLIAAATFNLALQKILDYLDFLQTNASLLGANVFTAAQQVSAGDVELTNAAIQRFLKAGGGKLQVGTKTGNASDLEFVVNGVVKAILRASDGKLAAAAGFDAGSQKIVNVTDPSDAQDADTMAARIAADAATLASAQAYADGLMPSASMVIAAAKILGSGTISLSAGAFGVSGLQRVGGAPNGRYQMTVAGATSNSIVIVTPGNNGAMGSGLVLAAGVSGTTVSVDARDAAGTLIDVGQFVVTVLKGA